MTRVLVVDDQPLFRAGLVALLNAAPDLTVVGEAADAETAVGLAQSCAPDVILLDIRLPGLAALTRVTKSARVLVLTSFDLDEYVQEALRLGAAGFVLKESEPERLLAAISAVASGEMQFSPTVMRRLVAAYLLGDPRSAPWVPVGLDDLTEREREVLRLVATGMTNAAIATRLSVTEGTVKTHLNRVMTKLRLTSRAQAVVTAYESGLVTPQPAG
ncbi:response regulator [Lentzea flava]|uniref:DNA-binding response regulator n=1 Tax=Lentzea flava TaxID=103732 RepID=A0ABQ2V5G1_9PSEU|nr:response regulator transcription factor [Lentzea flava]MCP2202931.1 DNA-binding response regulator, NarL/FixJ family, contains REC and HTH domains [Lentzea flava]GGU64569.1 DNA-binding response regulator [Lentzea flava]